MDTHSQIAEKIIKAQENVMGLSLALAQAKKVNGLKINWEKHEVSIEGNKKTVLEALVKQYEHLFGQASIKVCRDAVKNMLSDVPKDQLPSSLAS